MSSGRAVVMVLLVVGCTVLVLSCCATTWVRPVQDRLHLLSPVTSLGTPLIAAALVTADGWSLTSGEVVLITVLLAVSSPVIQSAAARVADERSSVDRGGESPE